MKPADLPPRVHRIGRRPDPFAWPDWAFAEPDGTFGNRFDDPSGTYRVLYAATEREGAYIETLARFWPDPSIVTALRTIDAGPDEPTPTVGVVPHAWFAPRIMGTAMLEGSFVDLGAAETLGSLHRGMQAQLVHHGITELDGAAIRTSAPRRFTQEISRFVYEAAASGPGRRWDGVAYLSRLGDDLQSWACFEPNQPASHHLEDLRTDDPALHVAVDVLGLTLEPAGGDPGATRVTRP